MKHQEQVDRSVPLAGKIQDYFNTQNIPFLNSDISCEVLAMQLIESMNRIDYFRILSDREVSIRRTNPQDPIFDPVKAILYFKDRDYDEACWLTFLLIYTGENYQSNWYFMRKLYGGLGKTLTWEVAKNNPQLFTQLASMLSNSKPKPKFGNHRKYESLDHLSIVFGTYVSWINNNGGHENLFRRTELTDPKLYFNWLYNTLSIYRFGRLAKFDYLSMLSKTGLANIESDSCYLTDSTGPKLGARLLFGNHLNNQLEIYAMELADYLGIGYQEMEDALCNWQKSPRVFHSYTG